ncbi:MAG: phosphatidylserine decarboxylase [Elusimicrobiota bacterium]
MKIVREAYLVVLLSLTGLCFSLYAIRFSKLSYILVFLFLTTLVFSLYFFRDPKRNIQFSEDEIASPADGTIISISNENFSDILVVRIFLSVFDVHLQRTPINGKVKDITFTPGKFHIAYKPQAKDNQRNIIKIEGENNKWAWVEQITGAIARRIVSYVKVGDYVKTGDKIGMIYFGSQVALYLPKDVELKVSVGDKVKAGETLLGLWKKN